MFAIGGDGMKNALVVLAGPTAVGKTALSISLAHELNAEIISGDSMQVYRGMDIGTGKIKAEEMDGIPHHLLDIKDPKEGFSAAEFQVLAKEKIIDITNRGKLPMIVGGTGLYLSSLIYDYDFAQTEHDEEYRAYLNKIAQEEGNEQLLAMLSKVDKETAERLNLQDTKRIIRALEVYHLSGQPLSKQKQQGRERESAYNLAFIVLDMNRQKLYQKIEQRIDGMLEDGWLKEVQWLLEQGLTINDVAMQGLGYRQLALYLNGEISYERAVELTKRDTRHFAKRQLTWFRHESNVNWINKDGKNEQQILEEALAIIRSKV